MRRRHRTALGIALGTLLIALGALYLAASAISSTPKTPYSGLNTMSEPRAPTPEALREAILRAPYHDGWKDGVPFPELRERPRYTPYPLPHIERDRINEVPEPSTLLLVLGALCLVRVFRRRTS